MNILIAPDSFKGSLSAKEVSDNIALGVKKAYPKATLYKLPLADGGEGTVDAFLYASKGQKVYKTVTGPYGQSLETYFGILGDKNTAIIEIAAASGLEHVSPNEEGALKATTFGTGELIKAAIDYGVKKVIIGLGGSATTDAGMGLAQALGARFLDHKGQELGFGGGELHKLRTVCVQDLDPRIRDIEFLIASDVNNPLYGKKGAAHIFGPQKGANPEQVDFLDAGLMNWAKVVERDLGKNVAKIPGAGAAGGAGACCMIFLNANISPGIDLLLSLNNVSDQLRSMDLVITGEGKLDAQTLMGKAPYGIARKAKEMNIPVIGLAGSVDLSASELLAEYFSVVLSITQEPVTLSQAKEHTKKWLQYSAEQLINSILLIKG